MDTIGYLEMLIKNKTEREADNKPEGKITLCLTLNY